MLICLFINYFMKSLKNDIGNNKSANKEISLWPKRNWFLAQKVNHLPFAVL